ncbi:MAG: hypothetical protein D6719_09750, partial [Candidatus Dadabacteria bacterium]
MIALARYTRRDGGYTHSVTSFLPPEPEALSILKEENIEVIPADNDSAFLKACSKADIVQVEWWNSPEVYNFFR